MGKQKYQLQIERFFKKSPVVDFKSIERIIKGKKNIKQYTKQLIGNLIKKGKIIRLTKGYYTSHEEITLIVFCFQPAYLGLQNALSYHNIWEQQTVPIVLTTKKTRTGIRKVMGLNVIIKRISPKYFFGFDYYKDGDFYFPYSDIEKTFIDMVYFKMPLSDEIIKEFRKRIDKKKLNEYLKKYPKIIRKRVLSKFNKNEKKYLKHS